MGDNVFVNADRTEVVEQDTPGKKFQMRRKDAVRLGLLEDGDEPKPQARRNAREDTRQPLTGVREDSARSFSTTSSPEIKDAVATPKATKKK